MEKTSITENVTLIKLPSREAFAQAIASSVAEMMRKDIESKNYSTLAVSGGTTPGDFFAELAKESFPWEKVAITLADDRWLSTSHPDSSEKLVRDVLLQTDSTFVGLVNKAPTPEDGEAETHRNLLTLKRPFTVTVLGMGEDGHCASLFPNNAALKKAFDKNYNRLCVAVNDAPKPPPQRITLTFPVLTDTGRVIIHLLGKSKIDALMNDVLQEGPVEDMPVRAFLRQTKVPVDIYYAD